jgi:hypothetical protein
MKKLKCIEQEEDKYVRYHWMHAPKEEFFEFRIEKSEITNQTILIVKDICGEKRNQRSEQVMGLPGERSFSPSR